MFPRQHQSGPHEHPYVHLGFNPKLRLAPPGAVLWSTHPSLQPLFSLWVPLLWLSGLQAWSPVWDVTSWVFSGAVVGLLFCTDEAEVSPLAVHRLLTPDGFSHSGAQALGTQASGALPRMGSGVAVGLGLSCSVAYGILWTRDQTVSHIASQVLNHWTTREARM